MREFRGQLEWIFSALGITARRDAGLLRERLGDARDAEAWALDYMGHRRVRILDGGLKLAGAELTTAVEPVTPGAFAAAPREETFASRDYIVERLGPRRRADFRRAHRRGIFRRARAREACGRAFPARSIATGRQQRGRRRRVQAARGVARRIRATRARSARPKSFRIARAAIAPPMPTMRCGSRASDACATTSGSWGEWGNRDELPIEHPRRK